MGAIVTFPRRLVIGVQTCGLVAEVKEPIMHPSRPKSIQLVLFDPPDRSRPLNTPQWRSLPPRTRRRAIVLMTRLFLPAHVPVNAWPPSSRMTAHDSGYACAGSDRLPMPASSGRHPGCNASAIARNSVSLLSHV